MRRFAQGLFGLAMDIVGVILGLMVGGIGAVVGFVIGFIIFGMILGLKGWFQAVPELIVAGLGFVIGVLLFWGLTASVDDVADAVWRKLRDDGGGEDR
jgi:L-lactate permease